MKAMIRLIKQTRLKSDIKCHISSDFFPHSEVPLGVSKEAKNLSNCAVEKQLIRCKETVFCCFIHSECYAEYTAVVRNWPRIPLMPDPLQTAEARLPIAPPFLALCPLQSQLRGYQFQTAMGPIPVLPTTSWPAGELGQEFKPMRAKEN